MVDIEEVFRRAIQESSSVILDVVAEIPKIKKVCEILIERFEDGGKVLIFGNGGSAADSQHFAAELVGKFRTSTRKPLPAIALTTDTSALTAISNDWEFPYVFERQIEALGKRGDVAFGISTSGRSINVLRALKKAKEIGLITISLSGKYKDEMEKFSDIVISVNSQDTQRIQEAHSLIIHLICEGIEIMLTK
ncbi:MAG: SIS domain-containing protein [Candidatus Calescibacterium sp.]|jgi:D-sedoheptulose 7-phosphate isomerase|nr:SIS domain-containing protein [Candidatus Calescibacterium sp.]